MLAFLLSYNMTVTEKSNDMCFAEVLYSGSMIQVCDCADRFWRAV